MSPMLAGIWMGFLLGNAARQAPAPAPVTGEVDAAVHALEISQARRDQRETMASPSAPQKIAR